MRHRNLLSLKGMSTVVVEAGLPVADTIRMQSGCYLTRHRFRRVQVAMRQCGYCLLRSREVACPTLRRGDSRILQHRNANRTRPHRCGTFQSWHVRAAMNRRSKLFTPFRRIGEILDKFTDVDPNRVWGSRPRQSWARFHSSLRTSSHSSPCRTCGSNGSSSSRPDRR